jgi:hypothetical protein
MLDALVRYYEKYTSIFFIISNAFGVARLGSAQPYGAHKLKLIGVCYIWIIAAI